MARFPRQLFLSSILAGLIFHGLAHAQTEEVFADPGFTNPKIRFNTGRTTNFAPEISPVVPNIPGSPSPWYVAQWNKQDLLRGDKMVTNDRAYSDARLGTPTYTFNTTDGESRLSIFVMPKGNVFELGAKGGSLSPVGGSDILLAANAARASATLDKLMIYSLDIKLSQASVRAPPAATQSGAVLVQVVSGFTVQFADPKSNEKISIFMQLNHAESRGRYDEYRACYPHDRVEEIVTNYSGNLDYRLPFRPTRGPPVHATYNLNQHLCRVIATPFICRYADGRTEPLKFSAAAHDFKNWRVASMYVGLETEDHDARATAPTHAQQGDVSVAVQLSDLHVLRHLDHDFTYAQCAEELR